MIRSANPFWRMLWPARVAASPLYALGLSAHKQLYAAGIKKRYRPGASVICVGNLSMGGTGKTPLVIAICKMLQASGRKVAVLTRGYKKVGQLGVAQVANLRNVQSPTTARDIGDEPFLMTEKLSGVEILVSPDRAASARIAVEELGCDALVMDDGFQHWALERDLDIVVIDAGQPARLNHLMPWGNLREGWSALRRAQVAVIAKARNAIERDRAVSLVRRANSSIAIWHVDFAPRELKRLGGGGAVPLSALVGQPAILVCGIASPEGFDRTAETLGCRIAARFFYRDHFSYPDLVLRYLELQAEKLGARFLLTTEKDAVKLRGRIAPNAPWAALGIETVWTDPTEKEVRAFLEPIISSGIFSKTQFTARGDMNVHDR